MSKKSLIEWTLEVLYAAKNPHSTGTCANLTHGHECNCGAVEHNAMLDELIEAWEKVAEVEENIPT